MSVFSDCLIICFLLNLILGASSSEFHSISSTSESPQNQEELKKWKQKTKIVETEKLKGENKIKRHIKLLWKVFVNSNNNLLFDKALKNYLNAVMWHWYYFRKKRIGKAQGRKGEQEAQFELISKVDIFRVFSYNVKCGEVCFWD